MSARLEPTLTIGEILRDVASERPDNRERMRQGLELAGWPEAWEPRNDRAAADSAAATLIRDGEAPSPQP